MSRADPASLSFSSLDLTLAHTRKACSCSLFAIRKPARARKKTNSDRRRSPRHIQATDPTRYHDLQYLPSVTIPGITIHQQQYLTCPHWFTSTLSFRINFLFPASPLFSHHNYHLSLRLPHSHLCDCSVVPYLFQSQRLNLHGRETSAPPPRSFTAEKQIMALPKGDRLRYSQDVK